MNLIAIECNNGKFFIKDNSENKNYYYDFKELLFDNKNP